MSLRELMAQCMEVPMPPASGVMTRPAPMKQSGEGLNKKVSNLSLRGEIKMY